MNSTYDDVKILERVNDKIITVLNNSYINSMGLADNQIDDILLDVSEKCFKDIDKLVKSDPAAKPKEGDFVSSFEYVINSYSCVEAVIHYRVANYIYNYEGIDTLIRIRISRKICEEIKNRLKIDIHPEARIGVPFILDHGFGTVIGQTTDIGNNCYILNCVTLGASGIGQNQEGKRHPVIGDNVSIGRDCFDKNENSDTKKDDPTIGDDVEIGAHVGIYGPVKIGNNVKINPHCLIGIDIPDNHVVSVSCQIQTCNPLTNEGIKYNMSIYGVVPVEDDQLLIFGENLSANSSFLVDEKYNLVNDFSISIKEQEPKKMLLKFNHIEDHVPQNVAVLTNNVKLVLRNENYEILIMKSPGLKAVIHSCIQKREESKE